MTQFPLNIIQLDTIDSTNNYMKALLKSGEPLKPYTVVCAREQTAGRGRQQRAWHTEKQNSLCMSLCVPFEGSPSITLLCALGVHKALQHFCHTPLEIKWPNDIIAHNRKLCGILTEGVNGYAVIGIGININNKVFPSDIAHKATSLHLLTGDAFSLEETAEKVACSVFEILEAHHGKADESTLRLYRNLCANIGRKVVWQEKSGVATDIDPDGSLVVSFADKEEKISFGEVTITDIY
ncbi:MAG: biotin--[Ruminococcus sp.]|nr:biotin--[acetyl-CoA-carboxylase] ligase [Ruminococcus sp.]